MHSPVCFLLSIFHVTFLNYLYYDSPLPFPSFTNRKTHLGLWRYRQVCITRTYSQQSIPRLADTKIRTWHACLLLCTSPIALYVRATVGLTAAWTGWIDCPILDSVDNYDSKEEGTDSNRKNNAGLIKPFIHAFSRSLKGASISSNHIQQLNLTVQRGREDIWSPYIRVAPKDTWVHDVWLFEVLLLPFCFQGWSLSFFLSFFPSSSSSTLLPIDKCREVQRRGKGNFPHVTLNFFVTWLPNQLDPFKTRSFPSNFPSFFNFLLFTQYHLCSWWSDDSISHSFFLSYK